MSAVALDADRRRKIVAAGRLMESDKPGEVLAAMSAIRRLLPDGVSLAEVIERAVSPAGPSPRSFLTRPETRRAAAARQAPERAHQSLASACLDGLDLSPWERDFCTNLLRSASFSLRQSEVLRRIASRLAVAA